MLWPGPHQAREGGHRVVGSVVGHGRGSATARRWPRWQCSRAIHAPNGAARAIVFVCLHEFTSASLSSCAHPLSRRRTCRLFSGPVSCTAALLTSCQQRTTHNPTPSVVGRSCFLSLPSQQLVSPLGSVLGLLLVACLQAAAERHKARLATHHVTPSQLAEMVAYYAALQVTVSVVVPQWLPALL